MKRLLFSIVLLLGISSAMAQTNFRHVSYAEGVAAAKAEGKLVFIDFYTEWCGPCKMMANNIFPQKAVGDYFNEKFVCLKIDAEKGEGVELAKRFEVRAYPTFIVMDANEKVLGTRVGGSGSGEEFIGMIERIVDPEKTPERMKARYDGGERSADLIAAYAGYLIESARESRQPDQGKIDEANKMVNDYFNSLTDEQKVAEENAFIYLQYAESPMDEYGRYMVAHREEFVPAVKESIAEHISKLYDRYLISVLAGYAPYDKAGYETVKREMKELNLNTEKKYDPICRIIESYAAGDMNAYFDTCEREYGNLEEGVQGSLVFGMNDLIKDDDQVALKRAVKFIRSKLADMPANNIYFAGMVIGQLEDRIKE